MLKYMQFEWKLTVYVLSKGKVLVLNGFPGVQSDWSTQKKIKGKKNIEKKRNMHLREEKGNKVRKEKKDAHSNKEVKFE